MTLVDDFTHFAKLYLIDQKSEPAGIMQDYIERAENRFSYRHLKVVSSCHALIPMQKRMSKFSSTAIPAILVGYSLSHKAYYRIYDPVSNEIFISNEPISLWIKRTLQVKCLFLLMNFFLILRCFRY